MVAWLFPNVVGSIPTSFVYRPFNNSAPPSALEARVLDESLSKIVTVYRTRRSLGAVEYFDPRDKVGEAVPVSSDGWYAFVPTRLFFTNEPWYAVTPTGLVSSASVVVTSTESPEVFFKVRRVGSNLLHHPFESTPLPLSEAQVFVVRGGKARAALLETVDQAEELPLTSDGLPRWILRDTEDDYGIIVDRKGRLIGLKTPSSSFILTVKTLESRLPLVFSEQRIERVHLGVTGWYTEYLPTPVHSNKARGFLITTVQTKNSPLKKGDVIFKI
jgi:hypothetical protein